MEELKSVVINIEMNKDMDDIYRYMYLGISRSLFQSGAAVAATSEETNLCMKS